MQKNSARLGRFEQLETRRLLAIDLQVEHDPYEPGELGEEVNRVIRVFNNGDELAKDVVIRSSLSDELEDAFWARQIGPGRFRDPSSDLRRPDFTITTDLKPRERLRPAGDINGDGSQDFAITEFGPFDSLGITSGILFGGIHGDVSADSSSGHRLDLRRGTSSVWNFAALGDVNGDGFDDFANGQFVVFGRADIHMDVAIDFDELDSTYGIRFTDVWRVFGVGDVNGDGLNDLASSFAHDAQRETGTAGHLIFGHPDLDIHFENSVATLTEGEDQTQPYARPLRLSMSQSDILQGAPAGDLNADGFQDAIFGVGQFRIDSVRVVFGGSHLEQASARGDIPAGFDIREVPSFGGIHKSRINGDKLFADPAGDIDGDGIDDLVLTIDNDICSASCTATEKSNIDLDVAAMVMFGSPTIGQSGAFDLKSDRHATSIVAVSFSQGNRSWGPAVELADINDDGLTDIRLGTNVRGYVIYGGEQIATNDLGFIGNWFGDYEHQWSESLNGENGIGMEGDILFADINADGFTDELRKGRGISVFLGEGPRELESTLGRGDIQETLDIMPGRSVVYRVQGTLKDTDNSITSTARTLSSQSESDIHDNVVSDRAGVDLSVGVSEATHIDARKVKFRITVENHGPNNATNVKFVETISNSLENVEWTRIDQPFPANVELGDVKGADGIEFRGPDRVYSEFGWVPRYDQQSFYSLGSSVGSEGDVNKDGFDDFYSITGFIDPRKVDFLGAADFGRDGNFPVPAQSDTFLQAAPTRRDPIADVNGDGFPDKFFHDSEADDFRGATYVVFGKTADGTSDVNIVQSDEGPEGTDQLNGSNGFKISGAEQFDFSGYDVTSGDINGDSFDDIIIAEGQFLDIWFRDDAQPNVAVVFGGAEVGRSGKFDLASLDGLNGIRLTTPDEAYAGLRSPHASILSDLDINGDGIDDLIIGNSTGGESVGNSDSHGVLYVVFGRRAGSDEGSESVVDLIDVPFRSTVTYTVTGQAPDGWELGGSAQATADATQVELDPRNNDVTFETPSDVLLGDIDIDGEVGFRDFLILAENFQSINAVYAEGDLDGNSEVNFLDFLILAENFGKRPI